MRKVRVIREMPYYKIGDIFEYDDNDIFMRVSHVNVRLWKMIQDGWLEEVVDDLTFADKLEVWMSNNMRGFHGNAPYIAKLAMTHAVEVAKKAIKEYDKRHAEPNCKGLRHFIIDALKQEAELNKTKES